MTDDRQLEAMLRDGMAAEARPVVADAGLTERIISTAVLEPAPPEPRLWQNWVLPAVAAVLVALLVGSVLFGTKLLHSSSAPPANHPTPTPSLAVPVSPPPSAPRSSPAPSGPGSSAPGTQPATSSPVGGPVPTGFSAYDLTWISANEGWALGTAPCSNAPCTSIVRTTDGGQSWIGMPAPRAYLAAVDICSGDCQQVQNIRFVSTEVGYVFGPNSFWMSTDGGQSWQIEAGNSLGLELAGNKVVRVSSTEPDCAPGCTFQVQRTDIGSTDWQTVGLPSGAQEDFASLSASGDNVALTTTGNPAGGANNAQSVVFRSVDAGASWSRLGEPCPQTTQENDSTTVSVAQDGSSAALCHPRGGSAASFLAISAGSGQKFIRTPADPDGSATVATAISRTAVLAGGDHLYRWDGSTWQLAAGPTKVRFVGFESPTIGRVLADNGLWTTTDGGVHWSPLSY